MMPYFLLSAIIMIGAIPELLGGETTPGTVRGQNLLAALILLNGIWVHLVFLHNRYLLRKDAAEKEARERAERAAAKAEHERLEREKAEEVKRELDQKLEQKTNEIKQGQQAVQQQVISEVQANTALTTEIRDSLDKKFSTLRTGPLDEGSGKDAGSSPGVL